MGICFWVCFLFLCKKKKRKENKPGLFIVSVWSNFMQISETRCHWWQEKVSVLAPEVFANLSSQIPSFGVIVVVFFFMLSVFCVWLESSLLKAILLWLSPILFIYFIFCGHYVLLLIYLNESHSSVTLSSLFIQLSRDSFHCDWTYLSYWLLNCWEPDPNT